jgi:hypothetical protein
VKYTDEYSTLERTTTFVLTVSCVRSIAIASTLTEVEYWIRDTKITRTPIYNISPSNCPYELVLTVTLDPSGDLPHAITNTDPTITVEETDYELTGVYKLKIVATDPKTGEINEDLTLDVTVFCTKTVDLFANSIASFDYQIVLASENTVEKTLPTYKINPIECAKNDFTYELVYTEVGTYPTFVLDQYPTTKIRFMTQSIPLVGSYDFKLVVTEPLTGLQNDSDVFTVTILDANYATALNFVASSLVDDLDYLISDDEIILDPYEFTVTPADADVEYEYSLDITFTQGNDDPYCITLIPQPTGCPKIKIYTTDTSYTGIYSVDFVLHEKFSDITIRDTFELTVKCVRDIKMENSIDPVEYEMWTASTPVTIPKYTLTPSTCPDELIVTNVKQSNGTALPHAISYTSGMAVDIYEDDQKLRGTYQVKVTVKDPKTSLTNSQLVF